MIFGSPSAITAISRTAAMNSTAGRSRRSTRQELRGIAGDIAAKGIDTVAITSVFSPVSDEVEQRAGAIFRKALPIGAHHAVERDRPHRAAGARERGDHERVPASICRRHVIAAFRRAHRANGHHGTRSI